MQTPDINIGIGESNRKEIADGLAHLLADTYMLYVKTHNFHWNVTGPMFHSLHAMFEEEYTEMAQAIDEIAERIRALGVFAPGSLAQFDKLSDIQEETDVPSAEAMVRQLITGHQTVVQAANEIFPLAEAANDQPTADMVTARMQIHEKYAWMLRSMLGE